MSKLIPSNCGAKKVTCSSFLGMTFSVEVSFGWFSSTTYKPKHMVKVTRLQDGKNLDMVKEGILATVVGGEGFGAGWLLGRSLTHKKKNAYEIQFTDGNAVSFVETESGFQKKLDELVLEKRGY